MTSHYDDKKDYASNADHIEAHQDSLAYNGGQVGEKDHDHYISDAAHAAEAQKSQTVREALRMYTPAIVYSVVFSAAIIMEGYDTLLLGQFYAQDAFARRFGEYVESDGTWQIPSKWQISLGVSVQVGSILGLQVTGWASEKIGYRKTMMIALVALTGILFIQFFAVNIEMLLAGYLLLGFPWGTFQTMTVSYAAEVMPVQLRPFLTTYVNLCWVIGQIICSGVNRAFIGNTSEWAYKIPFAIQWIYVVPIFIGILMAPESPWWLVRAGKFEEAEKALMKLTTRKSGYSHDDAKSQVALIHHTNELEKSMKVGTSYFECFKMHGGNLRRTEIACMVWLIQTICGSPLMGMATYFFRQAGLAPDTASTLNLIMFVVGGVGTVCSWPLMGVAGRRTIYNWGQVGLSTLMLLTGILGCLKESAGRGWGIGAILISFTGLYDLTVGPVCYSLVAEIGSTRLRSKTVVLARNLYNVGGIVVSILNPLMLNPGDWNWGPKSAFLWLGTGVLGLVWSYFRLPEPKGRTYGELDILFESKVPARQFASTIVDQFEAEQRDAEINKQGGGGAAMAH